MMAYNGRLAIIAGGLGGLGTATSLLLRSKGARLALLYAPFEASRRVDILKSSFGSDNPDGIKTYECDITSEPSVQTAFRSISTDVTADNAFPSILVNAAGYVSVQPMEVTSAEEAARNILPNLLGPFIVSNAFFHLYQDHKSKLLDQSKAAPGRIVSISSQASHVALWGHSAYCASKAGLNGLTRCMANEWGGHGITANTVSPTVALTFLGRKAWADEVKREKHLAEIPTGRFAQPEEVAHAIEFLCQDGSGMMNGGDVRVDGGFTIR